MPAKFEFKLNRKAAAQLLNGDQVVADLRRRAQRVAAAAGPGHRIEVSKGKKRARAAVITETFEARSKEARSRNLTSALNAGRG